MFIRRIGIKNFKSFGNIEVELNKFNVFVGANASGKTNFVKLFQFLKDITESGLENAISLQGDEYLQNLGIKNKELVEISLVIGGYGNAYKLIAFKDGKPSLGLRPKDIKYKFSLRFFESPFTYDIVSENFQMNCDFCDLTDSSDKNGKEFESVGSGKFVVKRKGKEVQVKLTPKPKDLDINEENILSKTAQLELENDINKLVLEREFFHYFFPPHVFFADSISLYDMDPKSPKKATTITGNKFLETDVGNLAIVLRNILQNKDDKRKFVNFLKELLPFVEDLDVVKFSDKSLLLSLCEKYYGSKFLPAPLLSDGTMNITALIVILYFETEQLTIIEEPGRNLHPFLISNLVDMMKDASDEKQIIVTTHNPEFLKHVGSENIFLVSRGKEGNSSITKPINNEQIKQFLEDEMGVEELYIQSLLEVYS